MKIVLWVFAVLDGFPSERPRPIEDFGECTIGMNLDAYVVIRYVVCRKGKGILHCCFYLHMSAI